MVPLNLAIHYSDIKIKHCCPKQIPRSFVTRLCAYNRLRYQVSVYRIIGPLVALLMLIAYITNIYISS